MSLILDALNKAQRERDEQCDAVPQLATVHYSPPPLETRGRRRFFAGIALVVSIAALGIGAAMMPGQEVTGPAPGEGATGRDLARQSRPSPEPERAPTPYEPEDATAPVAKEVSSLYRANQQAEKSLVGAVSRPSDESIEASQPLQADERSGSVTEPEAEQTKNESALPAKEQETIPPFDSTPTETETLAAHEDVPHVQALSRAVQQDLPSLTYTRHEYQASPASRFVELNGAIRREGSEVATNTRLEKILRDGIILRYRDRRFKLEALNSWVNF